MRSKGSRGGKRVKFTYYRSSYKGRRGWRFRLTGANGEKVATGEWYVSKFNVVRAIQRIQIEAAGSTIEEAEAGDAPVKGGKA